MTPTNGEAAPPSFEELAEGLSQPIPPRLLANPERLWGSLYAAQAVIGHLVLALEPRQKEQILNPVAVMRDLADKVAFERYKVSGTIEPRFAGMLDVLDEALAALR